MKKRTAHDAALEALIPEERRDEYKRRVEMLVGIGKRPYLTSVGIAVPRIGFSKHFYLHTRRQLNLRRFQRFGLTIVLVSYQRLDPNRFND